MVVDVGVDVEVEVERFRGYGGKDCPNLCAYCCCALISRDGPRGLTVAKGK